MSLKSKTFSVKRLLLIIKVNNDIYCCTVPIRNQLFDSLLASTIYIIKISLKNKDPLKAGSRFFAGALHFFLWSNIEQETTSGLTDQVENIWTLSMREISSKLTYILIKVEGNNWTYRHNDASSGASPTEKANQPEVTSNAT